MTAVITEFLLGTGFGSVMRLLQRGLDLWDKQKERDHEHRMFEKQIKLMRLSIRAETDLRQMKYDEEKELDELLRKSLEMQSRDSMKIGGWVAKLSATVRPFVTYGLFLVYLLAKLAVYYIILHNPMLSIADIYTEYDGALFGSVIGYWIVDRSLGKRKNG